jgi:tryptophan 2,3-dioxygenase
MATSYWDYVRVEELLALQSGIEREEKRLSNHEVLFIAVHQVFELWFKLILRELVALRDVLKPPRVPEADLATAARSLDRVARIFRSATQHWDVVESLNTRDYLDFRDKLFPASGFQSAQLREIEIVLGLEDADRVGFGAQGAYLAALKGEKGKPSPALARVEARRKDRPTVREALESWLHRTPIRGSQPGDPGDVEVVGGFLDDYLDRLRAQVTQTAASVHGSDLSGAAPADLAGRYRAEIEAAEAFLTVSDQRRRRIRAAIVFIEGYRDLPLLAWPQEVLTRAVEAEQQFLVFRQRHARMVERVIGRRVGTGGSSGVDYLDQTATAYRVFKDLWTARTFLLRRDLLPPLADPSPYSFKSE